MADTSIYVTLPDGKVAEFPAGTSEDVIRQVAGRYAHEGQLGPSGAEAPKSSGLSRFLKARGEDLKTAAIHLAKGDTPMTAAIQTVAGGELGGAAGAAAKAFAGASRGAGTVVPALARILTNIGLRAGSAAAAGEDTGEAAKTAGLMGLASEVGLPALARLGGRAMGAGPITITEPGVAARTANRTWSHVPWASHVAPEVPGLVGPEGPGVVPPSGPVTMNEASKVVTGPTRSYKVPAFTVPNQAQAAANAAVTNQPVADPVGGALAWLLSRALGIGRLPGGSLYGGGGGTPGY